MCAFCNLVSAGPHWTEAGTDAGRSAVNQAGRTRYLDRASRVKVLNKILGHYGCKVSDWANDKYVVRSLRGHAEVVDSLPQVWAAVDRISRRQSDPLDPALLAALRGGAPSYSG